MRLYTATKEAVRYSLMNYHYAKRMTKNQLSYSVFNDENEFCGVVLFGIGANRFLGDGLDIVQGRYIELLRVALNGKQESTSKVVSIALRLLKKDKPCCRIVVSYADTDQGHNGTIYQASNWSYIGKRTVKSKKYYLDGTEIHSRRFSYWDTEQKAELIANGRLRIEIQEGKHKYIYVLDKNDKELVDMVKSKELPYPK